MTAVRKTIRSILALVFVLCLLVSAGSADMRQQNFRRNVLRRIEQGSFPAIGEHGFVPENCSGYVIQYRTDLPDGAAGAVRIFSAAGVEMPEPEEADGTVILPLDEETTLMILESANLCSAGPDGSILSLLVLEEPVLFVLRDKTLVLLGQSPVRGEPDTYGSLKNTLYNMLNSAPSSLDNEIRWSPDGRYLFFNDTDRWLGARMALDDPFLADTQTGEIFLIENGGYPKTIAKDTFRCVMNGRFSMDGKSFYWYCRSYVPGEAAAHSLMRYDLESGARETVCELGGVLQDFIETEENHWMLLETGSDGVTLVRMTVSADGIERIPDPQTIPWTTCHFLPAAGGKTMVAAEPIPVFGGSYLLPLTWDTPVASSAWYRIESIYGKRLQEISMDEIAAQTENAEKNQRAGLYDERYTGTALVDQASVITGTPYLLLTVNLREAARYSWPDRYNRFTGYVLLNTEDYRIFPLLFTGASEGEGPENPVIDGTFFLLQGTPVGLFCGETMPLAPFAQGTTYPTQFGIYRCKSEQDPLKLQSVTLDNRDYTASITPGENGYRIVFRFTDYPAPETSRREYLLPEAVTEARWQEIKSAISKKDQKKLSNLYTKISPDKLDGRENRDELLAAYPALATETMYVLKSDIKASNLEAAEAFLGAAGYTAEDYARDMAYAAVPRNTNVVVRQSGRNVQYPVLYTFLPGDDQQFPDNYRMLQLAGLCDQVSYDIMNNRASEAPLPAGNVIRSEYDMGGKVFRVTVESAEETADETASTLELTLTVIP